MSLGKNIKIAMLAALVFGCGHATDHASAVGDCKFQVAFVEGGESPSAYWMRLCDDSIEFQPLGSRTLIRRPPAERLSSLQAAIASKDFADAMLNLAKTHPTHRVPPHRAFFGLQYADQEVHVTPDQLPPIVREVFAEMNSLFEQAYPQYQKYLVLR